MLDPWGYQIFGKKSKTVPPKVLTRHRKETAEISEKLKKNHGNDQRKIISLDLLPLIL
jgi:hypothetical protein